MQMSWFPCFPSLVYNFGSFYQNTSLFDSERKICVFNGLSRNGTPRPPYFSPGGRGRKGTFPRDLQFQLTLGLLIPLNYIRTRLSSYFFPPLIQTSPSIFYSPCHPNPPFHGPRNPRILSPYMRTRPPIPSENCERDLRFSIDLFSSLSKIFIPTHPVFQNSILSGLCNPNTRCSKKLTEGNSYFVKKL